MDDPWLACSTRGTKGKKKGIALFVDMFGHPGKLLWLLPDFEVPMQEFVGNTFERLVLVDPERYR